MDEEVKETLDLVVSIYFVLHIQCNTMVSIIETGLHSGIDVGRGDQVLKVSVYSDRSNKAYNGVLLWRAFGYWGLLRAYRM